MELNKNLDATDTSSASSSCIFALYLPKNETIPKLDFNVTKDSSAWLKSLPRGAYTTARTLHGTHIIEFNHHVQRTCHSLLGLTNKPSKYTDPNEVQSILLPLLHQVLTLVQSHAKSSPSKNESKLTWFISLEFDIAIHRTALPLLHKPIRVHTCSLHRDQPHVKDTQFVHLRPSVSITSSSSSSSACSASTSTPKYHEYLMITETTPIQVMEGVSSNFFVYTRSQTIQTAPFTHVLKGTVLTLVIEACEVLNIPIKFEAPCLAEIQTHWWIPCLTSTSRNILPIDHLDTDAFGSFTFDLTSLPEKFQQLQTWVQQALKSRAVQILDT